MSQQLISLSPDLKRLRDEGYEIQVRAGYLVMSHVPYVTRARQVAFGDLVSELTLAANRTARPSSHVAMFSGSTPCDQMGAPLSRLINSSNRSTIGDGIVIDHTFSSKPTTGYADYYEKMTTYAAILGKYASIIDPGAMATTFRPVLSPDDDEVFTYVDTASSRAGIAAITARLATGPVAIVGLGGTGAYILDLMAKTPVRAIHLWDGDRFLQHNAFRAPGAPSLAALEEQPYKVDYFAAIYSNMHRAIVPHSEFVSEANVAQVLTVAFVFLALDSGPAKRVLVQQLEAAGRPFVDVGMGVHDVGGTLGALLRVTTSTPHAEQPASHRLSYGDGAAPEYRTNIQIADLNALNAALAVIRWKKYLSFYCDLEHEHHSTYQLDGNEITNEDRW
ncbi:MAG: ThiF family adenylyltransferase [Actinomycetota bacterium]|jgi:hypothetical protein|nr:ThiF family adenylyltransferase [Actinomycetota bacterium]